MFVFKLDGDIRLEANTCAGFGNFQTVKQVNPVPKKTQNNDNDDAIRLSGKVWPINQHDASH